MNRLHGKRLLTVLVMCALSLSAIAWIPSGTDTPQALSNEQWVAGALTGNGGGAFNYYAITYPGNGNVVTIELRFAPADPVTKTGFGFNVYGPNGFMIGQGLFVTEERGDGVLRLQYSDTTPATWLVQVYNYIPNHNVAYGIMANGLPAPQPVQPPAAPVAPRQPGPLMPLVGSGYLTGHEGGTFTYYNVTVAAGSPNVQLTMTCWPDYANNAANIGFVAFGPSGRVINGITTGTAGERKATLSAQVPGIYRVQVYNYIQGLTIQYMLRNQ